MTKTILIVAIFLLVGLSACSKQPSPNQRAKAKLQKANGLLSQSTKLTNEWTDEYKRAFNPENRKEFPGNRESLCASADKIIRILDEGSALERRMAEEFDEAGRLLTNEQERKGVTLIATALRKNIEINNLLKSQMKLVYDEEIKDEKTLSEKIMSSWQLVQERKKESSELLQQGKRALGIA